MTTLSAMLEKYRPDQERDERGRWVDEGGGGQSRQSRGKVLVRSLAARFKASRTPIAGFPRYNDPASFKPIDAKIEELEILSRDINAAKLSRADKHALAKLIGSRVPASYSGAKALQAVTRRVNVGLQSLYRIRATGGRSAG
jgi:hypothetical protein